MILINDVRQAVGNVLCSYSLPTQRDYKGSALVNLIETCKFGDSASTKLELTYAEIAQIHGHPKYIIVGPITPLDKNDRPQKPATKKVIENMNECIYENKSFKFTIHNFCKTQKAA